MIPNASTLMIVVVSVGLALLALEVAGRRSFRWHLVLRCIWIVLLGLLVADWMSVRNQEFSQPSMIHILFDRSDSIGRLPERAERTKKTLEEIDQWAKKSKQPVKYLSFADSVIDSHSEAGTLGGNQSLLNPVAQQLQDAEGVAVLLSDGNFQDQARMPIPTFSVQMGRSDEKDVWIESVQPVYTAFLKNRLKIPLTIGQKGFKSSKVVISLWRGTEKVEETIVSIDGDRTSAELSLFPEKMGESIYIVRVEPLEGEISTVNNEHSFRIRTVRDKIRILHIGGRPTSDLKAWRLFLTRQPDVDLVSFYILRSLNDDPQARNHELSLIPFPYEELFSTELEKVDLVVLQNFDFNLYFQPFYLSNLASFIRGGGALLVIGGDQSFHRYFGSPLEPLFPFSFLGMGQLDRIEEGVSKVAEHPIVSGSESLLRRLPLTAHHSIRSQSDSLDLAQYKSGTPFLSIRDVGKGRIMALNSDESWKLQMLPSDDPAGFSRLARRMIQYLTFDPEMDPQRLISTKWQAGKTVSLRLLRAEKSTWRVTPLAHFQDKVKGLEIPAAESLDYEVPAPGWYQIENSSLSEPVIFETEEKPWNNEWKKLISNDESLRRIAVTSGGRFLKFEDRDELFSLSLSGKQVIAAETTPFTREGGYWSWILLISSLLILFADFLFRKRSQWDA